MATNATKVVAQNQATADLIFNLAKKEGFSDIQATALVANSIQESSLNPGIKNFNPSSRDDSVGLFQLNFQGGMGVDFARAKGISIAEAKVLATNPTENASFIIADAKRKGFGSTRTAEEANRFLVKRVIRPGDQENEIRKRTAIHRQVEAELVRDPRAFGVNEESVATNTNDPDKFPDTRSNLHDPNLTSRDGGPVKSEEEQLKELGLDTETEDLEVAGLSDANQKIADDAQDENIESFVNFDQFSEVKITPKPNILTNIPTQTYKFTIFLQTPEQYKDMVLDPDGAKDTSQLMKIIESGGTGGESNFGVIPGGPADIISATSSPFKLDYYIDNVEFECVLSKVTGGPSNIQQLRFDIIEPFGFRFFEELRQACEKLGMEDHTKQHYLMVIEFRGEDELGQSITQKPGFSRIGGISQDDQNQLAEKYIPFTFTKIETSLDDGAVTYNCSALPSGELGKMQKFQVIPYNLEITGQTLEDIFNSEINDVVTKTVLSQEARRKRGQAQKKVDQAVGRDEKGKAINRGNQIGISAGRAGRIRSSQLLQTRQAGVKGGGADLSSAAGKGALGLEESTFIKTGIVSALNKFNKEKLAGKGTIQHPDKFKVTFLDGIGNAKLSKDSWIKANRDKTEVPMLNNENKDAENPKKNQINKTDQIHSIQGNTKLIKMLEQCIRSSTFITDQSVKKIHSKTKRSKDNASATGKPLVWFQITSKVLPYAYDEIRGCSAYEVEYIVNAKTITDAKSDFFLKRNYVGPHKKYDYWFTGKNTEVLEYKQSINAAYFAIVTGQATGVKQAGLKNSQSLTAKQFRAESSESQQQGGTNAIPGASAAGNLYSPSDFQKAKMTIIGDPDYITQTEIFYPTDQVGQPGAFIEQDGSINITGGDVLFELNFKTMSDYNDQTGLADIQDLIVKSDAEVEATGTNGLIYQINRFRCLFKGGVYTIELEDCTLREYADAEDKNAQLRDGANLVPAADATKRVSRIDNTGSVLLQSRKGAAEKARLARSQGTKQVGGSQARITASNNVIPLNNVNVDGTVAKSTRRIKAPGFFTSVQGGNLPTGVVTVDNFRDANDDATGN